MTEEPVGTRHAVRLFRKQLVIDSTARTAGVLSRRQCYVRSMLMPDDDALDYCYLTTIGRKSGEPREIEIWFGAAGETLYLLAGGGEKAHWVRNIAKKAAVTVRVGGTTYPATGRRVSGEEDALARRLLLDKYRSRYSGDLSGWGQSSLPIALDLHRL